MWQLKLISCLVCLSGVNAALDEYSILDCMRDVQRMQLFKYILLMKNQNSTISQEFIAPHGVAWNDTFDERYLIKNIMDDLNVAVLLLDERVGHDLYRKHDTHLLVVVYMDGTLEQHTGLLAKLVQNLHSMIYTRILFLINFNVSDVGFLEALFAFCWKHKFVNVAALFADYQISAEFFSYTPFPKFEIERKPITTDVLKRIIFYPARLRNLKGYKVSIKVGGAEPRMIPYTKPNGEVIYLGTVGHLMDAFKQKYNCQYVEPLPTNPNAMPPSQTLTATVRNGSVEIVMAVTFPTIPVKGMSYPYEILNWCAMMPVEADIPASEFYLVVFQLGTFLLTLATVVTISLLLGITLRYHGYHVYHLDFILHNNCLRGVLGQSFYEVRHAPILVRGIYLQICVLGLLLTTTFNSHFSTYVTRAPKEAPLQNLNDVMRSKLRILAWKSEYDELVGRIAEFKKYTPAFLIEPDYRKYLVLRESFNTDYGYMLPSTKWLIMQEQQKYFTRRLFRWRTDMCFFNTIPLGFPLQVNSIYLELINTLMIELADSGLSAYWRDMAFLELIKTKKLSFKDLAPIKNFRTMQIDDLIYIVYGYSFMVCLTTMIFLFELIWFHRKRLFRNKKRVKNV